MAEKRLESVHVVPGYTFFYWGFTLPKKDYGSFTKHFRLKAGSLTTRIRLLIAGKTYPARIRLTRITTKNSPNREVVQIYYERDYDTLKALRKFFIYSYASTIRKSKPKLKELMELEHMGGDLFKVVALSKQETDFDAMFRFMEEKNLFEFWRDAKKGKRESFFLDFARHWIPAKDLSKYRERVNVIYVLYSEKDKHLYVGKANRFGARLKEGQGRIGLKSWDKFMYFEIDPKYAHALEEIEAYTIRVLASLFDNDVRMAPLGRKVERLVNRQLRRK
ncbi:MAG: GIY-YIG nuclease family protein [bacterium]